MRVKSVQIESYKYTTLGKQKVSGTSIEKIYRLALDFVLTSNVKLRLVMFSTAIFILLT